MKRGMEGEGRGEGSRKGGREGWREEGRGEGWREEGRGEGWREKAEERNGGRKKDLTYAMLQVTNPVTNYHHSPSQN